MKIKTCSNPDCKQKNPQPIENFYKKKSGRDGYTARCKSCILEASRRYSQSERGRQVHRRANAKYRESQRGKDTLAKWDASEKGKQSRKRSKRKYARTEKNKTAQKRYYSTPQGKEVHRRNAKRYREKHLVEDNGHKLKARRTVSQAVDKGVLPQISTLICTECGKPAQEYHHYKGYDPEHWLDVVSLCATCHRKKV